MKRNFLLNLTFIALFIFFLVLSLTIDFFFFVPIICFLPLSFGSIKQNNTNFENRLADLSSSKNSENSELRYCPRCSGEITKSIAKFCYHCGEELNNK